MSLIKIFLIILIINIINGEKILFAFQMNRHGARSPHDGIVNGKDIFEEEWPENYELSNMGKRQLYLLGCKARHRYIPELISESYNPSQILIKSTDTNRTIESIYSFLQGLYPQGTGQNINEKKLKLNDIYPPNIKYREKFDEILEYYNLNDSTEALPNNISIIPIHLFRKADHDFQLYSSKTCVGLKDKYDKQNNREEIKNFADGLSEDLKNLLKYIEKNDSISFLKDYWNLYKYVDNIVCDKFDQRSFYTFRQKLEKDGKNIENLDRILDEFKNASEKFLLDDYLVNNNSTDLSLVDTSITFRSILNWMEIAKNKYIENNKNYIKYAIYSSHDSSIGAIDGFMYLFFNQPFINAQFAASRFFELYVDDNNNFKVRYLKDLNDAYNILDMDYEEFKNKIEKIIWDNEKINDFCGFTEEEPEEKKVKINEVGAGFMVILSIAAGFLISLLILVCVQQNIKDKRTNTEANAQ